MADQIWVTIMKGKSLEFVLQRIGKKEEISMKVTIGGMKLRRIMIREGEVNPTMWDLILVEMVDLIVFEVIL